jgi:TPR repeat protein
LRLVAVVVAALLVTFVAVEWRSAGDLSASAQPNTLQRARAFLQRGDDAVAVQLFSGLAKKNNPNAQYWLGHMTELGLGTKRDLEKAIELYKQAAEQNVVAAELRLGELYLRGNLVPPDSGQAKAYLERAAYHGEPRAAMLIGEMYRVGNGTPPDPIKAYAWWEVATIEGNTFAQRERDASLHALDVKDQKDAVARAKVILADIKHETTLKSHVAMQSNASGSLTSKPNTASSPTG